jgi:hypothetical protein
MTTYTEQIKELCDLNSLHYHIDNNRVLIDDEFWFYINNYRCLETFINLTFLILLNEV